MPNDVRLVGPMSRLQPGVCPMCLGSHCGMLPRHVTGQRGASSRTGFETFRDWPIWRVSLTAQASRGTHNRTFKIAVPLAAAGVLACAGAVVLTLSGSQSSNPTLDAEIRAAIIAAPIAVGLYAWFNERWARFGKLLVAAGFAWSLTTLAQSNDDFLYSAGRVFGWIVEPLLIYLVLAFPSGRLTTRVERRLVAASVLLVAVFFLPTMLLVDSYPTPSQWSSCDTNCPSNAFMLVGSEPGFVGSVILPFREAATMLLFAGVIAVLVARIRRGTPLMRITLVPVLAFAILHAARSHCGHRDASCRAGRAGDGSADMDHRSVVRRGRARLHHRALVLAAVREQGAAAARGRPRVTSACARPAARRPSSCPIRWTGPWRSSRGHTANRKAGSTSRESP